MLDTSELKILSEQSKFDGYGAGSLKTLLTSVAMMVYSSAKNTDLSKGDKTTLIGLLTMIGSTKVPLIVSESSSFGA